MKLLAFAFGVAILLTQPILSQPALTVYRDSLYPFSVSYPKHWERVEPAFPETRIKAIGDFTDFSVTVVKLKEAAGMSTEQFAESLVGSRELLKNLISKDVPNAQIVSSGRTYLNNKPSVFIRGTGVHRMLDESIKVTIYQTVLLVDDAVYLLSFRTPVEQFDRFFDEFKIAAATFVVRPNTASKATDRRYDDTEFPFSQIYPSDWMAETSGNPNTRLKLQSGHGDGGADFTVIAIRGASNERATPDEILNSVYRTRIY